MEALNLNMAENMQKEKEQFILEDYIKPRRFRTKFWLNLSIVFFLIFFVLLFKFGIINKTVTIDELKSSLEFFNISSQWVVKKRINSDKYKGVILVPQISLQIRNSGNRELKYVLILGIFRFVNTGKVIGEGSKMTFKKPLVPGKESQKIVLTSRYGYRASSEEAFEKNPGKWESSIVEIYVKSTGSRLFFFKSFHISKKIEGMNLNIKIS